VKYLVTLLEEVNDQSSFMVFAKALLKDREEEIEKEKMKPSSPFAQGPNGWENQTIENFLESAIAGAEGSLTWSKESQVAPTWKHFAEFLYYGKVYE